MEQIYAKDSKKLDLFTLVSKLSGTETALWGKKKLSVQGTLERENKVYCRAL